MNYSQIAKEIREEADDLLFRSGIDQLFRRFGEPIYTGSYILDLMAWRDIDLQLALPTGANWDLIMAELAFELAKLEGIALVKYEKDIHERIPSLPKGTYVGARIRFPNDKNTVWKLDIWALSAEERKYNEQVMKEIIDALTAESRELILKMKHLLMTPEGRTPSLSGFHLYQAVLKHGLKSEDAIRDYLIDQGVKKLK